MNDDQRYRPPRLAEALLRSFLPSGIVGESIVGDTREEYLEYVKSDSRVPGVLWYWCRVFVFARRYAFQRPATVDGLSLVASQPSITERLLHISGTVVQDLRFGVRTLRKRIGFTIISILTLGFGIGGTTAIFSVVDGVLIRDLPYRDPDRLVSVWKAWPSWQGVEGLDYTWDHIHFPWVDYQNVSNHATTLEEVAAFINADVVLTGHGEPERLSVGGASANLFDLLGAWPVLGRPFSVDEVPPAGPTEGASVAILSHELWTRTFGQNANVIGQTITLDGTVYEIIGVLRAGFRVGSDLIRTHENGGDVDAGLRDIWIPLRLRSRHSNSYELLARLAPGTTIDQARAEIQTLMTLGPEDQQARVEKRKSVVTAGFEDPLLVLLGAAGILLMVACVNIAGLLVGEATGRSHEVAVRFALGAGRSRVVRQLLTENVMLGLMGTALGLILAWIGTEALLSVAPPLPRLEEVRLSGSVLLFAVGAGLCSGLLFGLAPAATLAGRSVGNKLTSRGHSVGRKGRSLQAAVVSVQVALTVVLLVAAGLFGRSLLTLLAVDPGFDEEGLVSIEVSLPENSSASEEDAQALSSRWEHTFREILRATNEVPGVVAVTGTDYVPFGGGTWTSSVRIEHDGETEWASHYIRRVLPNYHEVMGIPLRSGRFFSQADGPENQRVMLVNESLAELYWPGESPVGVLARNGNEPVTIVGVVGDVKKQALSTAAEPTYYFPVTQYRLRLNQVLVVKTLARLHTVLPSLHEAIRSVDPALLIGEPTTLATLKRNSESDDRFRTILILTFAALATLLAAVGIFGVTARGVAARAREMGIRMALGAKEFGLVRLVVRDSMRSVVIGIVVGLVGAIWASSLFEHFLFGVGTLDVPTYSSVLGFLMLVCFGAAFVPAMRITKINPSEIIAEE